MSTRRTGSSRQWTYARRRWAPDVAAGLVDCWRCGQRIDVGEAWDLGHVVDLAHGGLDEAARPEHRHARPGCIGNRAAGALAGNAARRTARQARNATAKLRTAHARSETRGGPPAFLETPGDADTPRSVRFSPRLRGSNLRPGW